MFASSPFGQSSSSPFGSQSVFGQTNNAGSNPFAPKPFGSTSPFGSQTGGSIFGSTSTGVFGSNQSSSSSPAFGASSSSAFGGSNLFGQKPSFGGFGSTPTQSSPFGSTFQQSQPAFGSSLFGSTTPFGASSQPAFAAASAPAFGATSNPAFASASTPTFGATSNPTFGATTTPAFGATTTPAFGATTTPAFGATSTPAFGATSTPAFGATSTPGFGATSTPGFGATSTPSFGGAATTPTFGTNAFGVGSGGAFGAASTPVFGSSTSSTFGGSSTPVFGGASNPAFVQSSASTFGASSTPAFGSSPSFTFGSSPAFGTTSSPFGAQSSPFGNQSTQFGSTNFGQSGFGGQRGGSRVAAYAPTTEVDSGNSQSAGKLESISAMPVYKDKSHEELRWEDYQLGDKGGPAPVSQSPSGANFSMPTQSSPFNSSPSFSQPSSNPFSSTPSNLFSAPASNPFAPKTNFSSSPFPGLSSFSSGPSASSASPFGSTSSSTPSLFPTTGFTAASSSSLFNTASSSGFGPSLFNSASAPGTSSTFNTGLNFSNTQSSSLFNSTAPSLGQTSTPFGQTTPFAQSSPFVTPSSGFNANFSSSSSLMPSTNPSGFPQTTPSLSTPFQPSQAQTSGFSYNSFVPQQAAGATASGGISFNQSSFGPVSGVQSSAIAQPVPIANPFGTLPAMPQVSIGRAGTTPSVQYGISSIPVVDKPTPVRMSPLLTSRHLSQRRMRLPTRKYNPKTDGPKVPFFADDDDTPSTPKADALFIPRENPRALVIRPREQWPLSATLEKRSPPKDTSTLVHENGNFVENGHMKEPGHPAEKQNGVHEIHPIQKEDSYITLTGHRAGEAAIVYEHGADIEALMPKLRHSDYFTEPRVQEMAAKERAEPGFCRHVRDFVVGRHGYGSIKFTGETDVRRLDLESLIQFNDREVIVYMDDNKKPPVGQGLNKPAEVTLLNIKCFDKKTGHQYTEGPKIEKYKQMLMRKAEDQGAEFVSYDPVKGEWKFRVHHFSIYKLGDEEDL